MARNEILPDQADYFAEQGWNGCKLWGSCKGTRCRDGDPDEAGRSRFRTPVLMPKGRPPGVGAADRRLDRCPMDACEEWMWGAINYWHAWSVFGGLPNPGSLAEQPSRILDAIGIIESEAALVRAYRTERATERAKRRG